MQEVPKDNNPVEPGEEDGCVKAEGKEVDRSIDILDAL